MLTLFHWIGHKQDCELPTYEGKFIGSYKPVLQQQGDRASPEMWVSLHFSFQSIEISPHLFQQSHSYEFHRPIPRRKDKIEKFKSYVTQQRVHKRNTPLFQNKELQHAPMRSRLGSQKMIPQGTAD